MTDTDIFYSFTVHVPAQKCFRAWTTNGGLRSFFSPNSTIECDPGGRFEILFDMDQPEGSRGSEGMRVMGFEEDRMFSFSWNSPPSIPELRSHMTMVTITFTPAASGKTVVSFRNTGYGFSEKWGDARAYFVRAWGKIVLPRFIWYMAHGTFDWDNQPDFSQYEL